MTWNRNPFLPAPSPNGVNAESRGVELPDSAGILYGMYGKGGERHRPALLRLLSNLSPQNHGREADPQGCCGCGCGWNPSRKRVAYACFCKGAQEPDMCSALLPGADASPSTDTARGTPSKKKEQRPNLQRRSVVVRKSGCCHCFALRLDFSELSAFVVEGRKSK